MYLAERQVDKKKFAIKVFDKKKLNRHPRATLIKKALAKEILIQRLVDDNITCPLYEAFEN